MYTAETFILEIVAALIGFSYPFIFQIIARIDDKYHSVNLVQLFKSEWWFKYYQVSLLATIISALIIPFLKIESYDSNALFNIQSIQFLSYILLILCLLGLSQLLHLIWVYYHPLSLHKRIESKLHSEVNNIQQTLEIIPIKIKNLRAKIIFAHRSEYYISDSEIEEWKNKIQKLTERLNKIMTDSIPNCLVFSCLGDLLRFSIKDGDTPLYVNTSTTFYWCIMRCKRNPTDMLHSKLSPSFPTPIITTINNIIQECINNASINPSLSNPSNYLYSLLPSDEIFVAPFNAYACVWYNIKKFERYNQIEWIEGYWSYVSGEASLWFYRPYYNADDKDVINQGNEILFQYQEFHHMIFAFLLSKGRYALIMKMRRYSNSIPYNNLLIPQSLIQMIKHLSALNSYRGIRRNMLYSFDSNNGTDDNNIAVFWLRLYYIISIMIFPFSDIDNIEWDSISTDKHEVNNYIDVMKSLISYLSGIIEKNEDISLSNGYLLGIDEYAQLWSKLHIKQDTIINLNNKFRHILELLSQNFERIKINEGIDSHKIKEFKARILDIVNQVVFSPDFPHIDLDVEKSEENKEFKSVTLGQRVENKDYFSRRPLVTFINFPESLANYCITGIGYVYTDAINKISGNPVKSFVIDYSEILLALKKLGVTSSSEHCILAFGISIESNFSIRKKNVFYIPSDLRIIRVYRTPQIPRMMINKEDYLDIDVKEDDKNKNNVVVTVNFKYDISSPFKAEFVQLQPASLEYKGLKSQLNEIEEFYTPTLSDFAVSILNLLKSNNLTTSELCTATNSSLTLVRRTLNELTKGGYIKFIGSPKFGKWGVL